MPQDYYDLPLAPNQRQAAGYTDAPLPQPNQSSYGALAMSAASAAAPVLEQGLEQIATNPGIKSAMSTVGQIAGGIEGLLHGGPLAAAGGVWAGSKAGWHTGKLLQRLAAPIASVAEKAAPYAQAASTLSGAQGVLDIAQMADPTRTDIGVLGVGGKRPETVTTVQIKGPNGQIAKMAASATPPKGWSIVPGSEQAERNTHPALINAMADAFVRSISKSPGVWSDVIDAIKARVP